MDFSIITEHSPYWIILVIAVALGMAYWQYHPSKRNKDFSPGQLRILGGLRFLSYFAVMVLLLSPLVKFTHRRIEKPILIWAQDNSESLLFSGDSSFHRGAYQSQVKAFQKKLEGKFDVKTITFGSKVTVSDSFGFQEKYTDFSELFRYLKSDFSTRNVGALVLASDGVYNKGNHPRYSMDGVQFPVFTIALGDTSQVRDLYISELRYNHIAFVKNQIPVQLQVSAKFLKGKRTQLRVWQGRELLYSKAISIDGNDFSEEVNFHIPANKSGLQHYQLELVPLEEEFTSRNNTREMVVDVLEARRKVLILYDAYHPDIAALRSAIETNQNYEVELMRADKPVNRLTDFDLVVLYQIPSLHLNPTAWLEEIERVKMPVLLVVGGQSDLVSLNRMAWGVEIMQEDDQFEEAEAFFNDQFNLFEYPDYLKSEISEYPPLMVPFGNYRTLGGAEVLFFQNIKTIRTEHPLVLFTNREEQKMGWVLGEGLWRWKLHNFMKDRNHEAFNSLINQFVQYLSLKLRKEKLVVRINRSYSEAENVKVEAELYNESFQPVNHPEMFLELISQNQQHYTYTFGRTARNYNLDIGNLPVGEYHYKVEVKLGDKDYRKEGEFAVVLEDLESMVTRANHNVLHQLAQFSGGKSFSVDRIDELANDLSEEKGMAPVVYKESYYDSVLKYSLFGIFLLMLMALEWFLRKFWGRY